MLLGNFCVIAPFYVRSKGSLDGSLGACPFVGRSGSLPSVALYPPTLRR